MMNTYNAYRDAKNRFFANHKYNFSAHTSEMASDGSYNKIYNFADGAQWFEYYGVAYTESGKMFKVEYFSTDNAESNCYYERY